MAVPGKAPGCAYRMELENDGGAGPHIRQRGGKWEVVDANGNILGRYDHKPAAEAAAKD